MKHRIAIVALLATLAASLPLAASANAPIDANGWLYSGMYSDAWASGPDLDAVSNEVGKDMAIGGTFYAPYNYSIGPDELQDYFNTSTPLESIWSAQSTPFVNIEIRDTAASIAAGDHDVAIDNWAEHIAAWVGTGGGRSLIVAPLQEMNGDWVEYGLDPANFKLAYAKFVDAIRSRGIDETKVRFAFAPNGWTDQADPPIAAYYPGDATVDLIGISAYNFGTDPAFAGGPWPTEWEEAPEAMGPYLDILRTFAPNKPYLIAQTASAQVGGDREAWLPATYQYLADDPNVVGIIYFNKDKSTLGETDWRVWDGASASTGFHAAMGSAATHHEWPLAAFFQPGAITVVGPPPPPSLCPDGADCDRLALVNGGSQYSLLADTTSSSTDHDFYFGQPGDVALYGDWDGDGVDTPAMFRPSNGFVYLRNSNATGVADQEFFFGIEGDIPIVGDWNGDGKDTLAIYRNGEVFVANVLGTVAAEYSFFFGNPGDRPFAGDFDGNGVDSVGLYRESSGFVYFRDTLSSGVADFDFFYGAPEDRIVAGDWDGDGDDSVAVYRPSTGTVYFRLTNTQGTADGELYVGSQYQFALRRS